MISVFINKLEGNEIFIWNQIFNTKYPLLLQNVQLIILMQTSPMSRSLPRVSGLLYFTHVFGINQKPWPQYARLMVLGRLQLPLALSTNHQVHNIYFPSIVERLNYINILFVDHPFTNSLISFTLFYFYYGTVWIYYMYRQSLHVSSLIHIIWIFIIYKHSDKICINNLKPI